jgi:hypothetical protein
MERLYNNWVLVSAPLDCGPEMLYELQLELKEDGRGFISDTSNTAAGEYSVVNDELITNFDDWTSCASKYANKDADIVDALARVFAIGKFKYELQGDDLILFHDGGEYYFEGIM